MSQYLIKIGSIVIPIRLRKTLTAQIIKNRLPLSGKGHKWGKEYYFYTKLNIKLESDARDVISKGEIAYWPKGDAIAIGYGQTPISHENEIRLADKCNIWADTDYQLSNLDDIKEKNVIINITQ